MTLLAEHKELPAKEPANEEAVDRRHVRLERKMILPAGTEPEKVEAAIAMGFWRFMCPRSPKPSRAVWK